MGLFCMHWANCKRYNGVNALPTALGFAFVRLRRVAISLWPPQGGSVCPHAQLHRASSFFNGRIRCVLVHDHVLLRQGLRSLLDSEVDLEVVAEAGNAAEALQRVCENQPEVVIADPATMGLSARDAESLFLRESPPTQVLFLTPPTTYDVLPPFTNPR